MRRGLVAEIFVDPLRERLAAYVLTAHCHRDVVDYCRSLIKDEAPKNSP